MLVNSCRPKYNCPSATSKTETHMLEYYKKSKLLNDLEAQLPDEAADVKNSVETLLEEYPSDTRALMILARCHQLCNEWDQSKQIFETLVNNDPANIPAKVGLARVLFKEKNASAAIELLTEATNARPDLVENWQLLGEYLQSDGQEPLAKNALDQYDMINAFNDNLKLAEQAFSRAEYVRADNMCRKLLELVPNEIRALRLLARLAKHFRHYEISTSILARCIEVQADNAALRLDYAKSLLANHKFQAALDQCKRMIELAPEQVEIYGVKAEVLYNLGQYQEAIAIYHELSVVQEYRAFCLLQLGKVLTTVGETAEAISCFQQVMELEAVPAQAYWELANLKTYQFSDDEITSMQDLLKTSELSDMDKIFIDFALGKAKEDAQRYSESFQHYKAANRGYSMIRKFRHSRQNAGFKSFFTREYFETRKQQGNDSGAPVFVLGLPRSGSTLVEQILTSHSQIDATMELPEIISISRELNVSSLPGQGQYPQSLAKLSKDQVQSYAQRYLDFVQPLRQQAPHFVDKLPGNFHHIGLIKTLFPNAKIIDIRRSPMASGWSLYRHFFAESFPFSYDLVTIGKYYNDYVELMDHWHTVLPGQILTIKYEDLVGDFPATVETLLQYCGLAFEEACLEFHLNQRAVATPSSEQVRQPIFDSAIEQWRNYEEFLMPLKQVVRHLDSSSVN